MEKGIENSMDEVKEALRRPVTSHDVSGKRGTTRLCFDLNLDELTTFVELVYLGQYVLNNYKVNHKQHKEFYLKIADEYKKKMLEVYPERENELEDIEEYLIHRCMDYTNNHELDVMPEFVLQKFAMIDGDPCLREKFKKLLVEI